MLWLLSALLTAALVAPAPEGGGLLTSPSRRVRSTDGRLTKLLEVGLRRSPTFAQLVESINATDVIVYIEATHDLPHTLAGRLVLLPIARNQRYVRIQVRGDLPSMDLISLIGHELRHALEIAEHPSVRDESAMLTLYQRIGHSTGGHSFDTLAALSAGRQVRSELQG